jgi:hypothetical protein
MDDFDVDAYVRSVTDCQYDVSSHRDSGGPELCGEPVVSEDRVYCRWHEAESNKTPPRSGATGKTIPAARLSGFDLTGIEFTDCTLCEADFSGGDLTEATFRDCDLSDADFHDADLRSATFEDCTFDETTLAGADLNAAWLIGDCELSRADLSGVRAVGTIFEDADLVRCDLSGSEFTLCTYRRTTFRFPDFSGASIAPRVVEDVTFKAPNFTQTQLGGDQHFGTETVSLSDDPDVLELSLGLSTHTALQRLHSDHGFLEVARDHYRATRRLRRERLEETHGRLSVRRIWAGVGHQFSGDGVSFGKLARNALLALLVAPLALLTTNVTGLQQYTPAPALPRLSTFAVDYVDALYLTVLLFTSLGTGEFVLNSVAAKLLGAVVTGLGALLLVVAGFVVAHRQSV